MDADELRAAMERIGEVIRPGAHLYLHCSAGIHRTGTVAYALLRRGGADRPCAVAAVRKMRAVTADALDDARVTWIEATLPAPS